MNSACVVSQVSSRKRYRISSLYLGLSSYGFKTIWSTQVEQREYATSFWKLVPSVVEKRWNMRKINRSKGGGTKRRKTLKKRQKCCGKRGNIYLRQGWGERLRSVRYSKKRESSYFSLRCVFCSVHRAS